MLVLDYYVLDDNLSETFGEITWKYKIDKLINKLLDSLNKLINRNGLSVETTELLNELLETLKIIEDCTDCKDNTGKFNLDRYHGLINKIENSLVKLEEEENINNELNGELFEIDNKLNKGMLCKGCKEEKIKKLTDKYGNEEIARFLYECKLNAKCYDHNRY